MRPVKGCAYFMGLIMTTSPSSTQKQINVLFKGIQSSVLNYNSFRNEIKKKKLSGELIIRNGSLSISLLFLQGKAVIDSRRIGVSRTLKLAHSPSAVLDFFILDDGLALAYSSTMNGKRIWESDSVTKDQIKKIAVLSKQKKITGHIGIHNGEGAVHRLFIQNGNMLGLFDVENDWKSIGPEKALIHGKKLELFLAVHPDYLLEQEENPFPPNEAVDLASVADEDAENLLVHLNDFISRLADKVGEKPVKHSLAKLFDNNPFLTIRGIKLSKAADSEAWNWDNLKTIGQSIQQFAKAMVEIAGKQWGDNQLSSLREEHSTLLKKLRFTLFLSV